MRPKTLYILTLAVSLASCASYPLGVVHGQPGQERDLAILYCKDVAQQGSVTPGSTLLGATIIGVPTGIAMEHQRARDLFASCMEARGFTVEKAS